MDFDDAKENIQPLAAGRNASILQAALHAESHQELQQQRRKYEEAIQSYEGEDPLEPWFEYIYWIEQSFPSGGKESGLEEVLLKCLAKFEKDERYHQDRRMIKLYIKYIDTHKNPQECYQQLYNQGIGTMVADLYICWAYYYDLSGNFRKADQIFRKGIDCRAQPLEELQEAHQHFGFTMSQRILYDDDNSKQKYQSTLQEKRQALTSLKSHRKKVGSVRTGAAVKSYVPGKVQVNSAKPNTSSSNFTLRVFEDENQDPNEIPPPEPAPDTSKSVVKTILESAREQENVKEPGPWNKAHDKKKGKLFASEPRTDLGFEILEDDDLTPIKGRINYGKPFVRFDGFVARNKPQEEWILPVTLENELMPRSFPSYDKCLLYPQPNMEFSPEELRSYYWYKLRNIENNFTKKYDIFWKTSINGGIRMYPNFARKNQPVAEEPRTTSFDPLEGNVSGKCKLVFNPKLCYPSDEEEELQFEEVIYQRWTSGERKLRYGGNETIAMMEEMEETICLPQEGTRRKSFFPTRKSIAPSHFACLSPNLDETENAELQTIPIPRRSVIMKTPMKAEQEVPAEAVVPRLFQGYEDGAAGSAFAFKTPAPPVRQQKLNFQIYEEEENNYDANETCSTQVFNCFIKAQSVSTPKAPEKAMKPSVERQPTNLNFSGIENAPPPNPTIAFSPPEYNDPGLTLHGKQLSTIMETSEQTTGNTASTKSSISSPELEGEMHSRIPLTNNACTLETVQEAGSLAEKDSLSAEVLLVKSLRLDEDAPTLRQHNEISRLEQREDTVPRMPTVKIFEEKTETVPKIVFAKAGNFSVLEDREDTTPSIKPVKFHEDKTETITKMILAPRMPTVTEIPADDEMLEFFAKSPEKGGRKASKVKNIFTPPPKSAANKSILSASAFMKFDSSEAKLKCNYDSPELREKHSSLIGVKKPLNLSFLPNFEDKRKTLESSVLKNMSATTGGLKQHSFSGGSSLQKPQPMEDSFLTGFPKETSVAGILPRQKSTEDSFLSGFPSVNIGTNKPQEDSFMSYLSKVGASKSKQAAEDLFMKDFRAAEGKKMSESSLSCQKNAGDSFMKVSSEGGGKNTNDSLMKSFRVTDNSFMPNLSTLGNSQRKKGAEDSFLPNLSANCVTQERRVGGELVQKVPEVITTGDTSRIQKPQNSFMGSFSIPKDQVGKQDLTENAQKPTKIGFLRDHKPAEDSFKFSFTTSPQQSSKLSFLEAKKTEKNKPRQSSKIPHFPHRSDTSNQQKPASQIIQSEPSSALSFLNSFSAPEPKKQPDHQEQKFAIFEDSNCQITAPLLQDKLTEKFTIFEDSTCQKKDSAKNVCFDASLKPDVFFEDNIRTEAFAPNLSMIKNSTWLPNHSPHQSALNEQSLHIKEEMSSSSTFDCAKSPGLSIFSSVPGEKSVDFMPPPPPMTSKVPKDPMVISNQTECTEISDDEVDDLGKSIYYKNTPRTPKIGRHDWTPEADQPDYETNMFIHRQVDLDHTQIVIDDLCVSENVNPFNRELTNAFLYQIDFTNYIEKLPTCNMVWKVKPLRKDCTVEINGTNFNVLKLIGEGSYGAVYCAKEPQSGRIFAMKQERPANLWEYYICLELRSRLNSAEVLPGFMNIEYALIGNNAGILVSNYSRYGSLISVCNKIKKKTLKNVDEYVVMHMASQLLLIIDHLHASNIIHADVKADNFLLMEKLVPGRKQPTIQLIDFGNSIDMDLFKKGQTFRYIYETESFKCVEMHEKRPWTYQLDLFGLAGVIHVLLFGKYMEIVKKADGWTHKTHVPRYFNKSLWETIFHSLLNIDDCQTMPNLQNLRAHLEEEIAEKDKSVCQKIVEFNRALDM